ncbi:MAG: ribosome maturation factor RimM [Cyanobacteria bacterium P01_A01_bin.3]
MPEQENQWLTVGKITSPHGLKGLVKVRSFSDFPERFLEPGKRWVQQDGGQPIAMQLLKGTFQPGKNLYLVQFNRIQDRNDAEDWTGASVLVPTGDRPHLDDEEYHVADLLGLEAIEQSSGRVLGVIASVLPAGNDLLEVRQGTKHMLIPFVKAVVPTVDIAAGRVEIQPPIGLIPDDW